MTFGTTFMPIRPSKQELYETDKRIRNGDTNNSIYDKQLHK